MRTGDFHDRPAGGVGGTRLFAAGAVSKSSKAVSTRAASANRSSAKRLVDTTKAVRTSAAWTGPGKTGRGTTGSGKTGTAKTATAKSSWPVRLMLFAIGFGLVTCLIFTPALDGRLLNNARFQAQLAITGVLLLRLGWAVLRKEQGQRWVLYAAVCVAAVPLWIVAERLVYQFAG
jgi:hypothetical protein